MRKRRAYPGSLYDYYGVEQWLAEQAREGLRLEKFSEFGSLGIFRQEEPRKIRYHVEPDFSSYRKAEEEYSPGEHWSFVCKVSGVCLVYETEDLWAVKPAKWKIEEKYLRRKHRSLWLSFFLWIITIAIMGVGMIRKLFPEQTSYVNWLYIFPLVLFGSGMLALVEFWKGLPTLYDIWVWRRSFLMEEEVQQHTVMSVFRWGEQFIWVFAIVAAVLSIVLASGSASRSLIPLDRIDDPLPLVTLDLMGEELYYAPEEYDPSVKVSVKHHMLLPEDILIASAGLYENFGDIDTWMKYGYLERPDTEMRFAYYRLWTEDMAVRLVEDEAEGTAAYWTCQKKPHDLFDDLWICDDLKWMGQESQRVIAREGDVVITVSYYGNGALVEHLDEIYQIVTDYRNS